MMTWLTIFLLSSFAIGKQTYADEIVKVNTQRVLINKGQHSVVTVVVEIKDGYHIQANKTDNEFIIPTTLEIDSDKIDIQKQVFPSTKKFKLEGTDEYLEVYDGRFEIRLFINSKKETQRGIHELSGKLKYQPCDSMRCLFPRTIKFSIDVEVR
jgi:hypothetical protein